MRKSCGVLFVWLVVGIHFVRGLTIINPRGPVPVRCLDCLCDTVSECSLHQVCVAGDACGPYRITPAFWTDAGRPTLAPGGDKDHEDAFVDCVTDKRCSERVVQEYMDRHEMVSLLVLSVACFTKAFSWFGSPPGGYGLTIINPRGPVPVRCLDCLCDTVSECSLHQVCVAGDACGPYRITPAFWTDAGRPTLAPGGDKDHEDAFVDCVTDKRCSERVVQEYMDRHKKDCNGDSKIDCEDFFALHILGSDCNTTLHENFMKRYERCDKPNKIVPALQENTNFFLPNYDATCSRCLCEAASGCNNNTLECDGLFCGLYKLSKSYWVDAGRPVNAGDDPDRRNAFEECALDTECAERTVKQYLKKFGRDCNGDYVTSCDDYLMIHFNENSQCTLPVDREWNERYHSCMMRHSLGLSDEDLLFK